MKIDSTGLTRIRGLELKKTADRSLILEPHEYIGKEPDTKFAYNTIKRIAGALGIPVHVASWICADEENALERNKRSFYLSRVFAEQGIGPNVFSQPSKVAEHSGHSSNIYLFAGHMGMYKNEDDGRILVGKLESERDGKLRHTCGAIYHVMNRLMGLEEIPHLEPWDVDLIGKLQFGLEPYKDGFLKAYNSGKDDLEKLSLGMQYLVRKNVDIQVQRLLEILRNNVDSTPDIGNHSKLVFGAITFNRFKYPDTTILTHAYLLKNNQSYDLTKTAIPINNGPGH